MCKLVTILNLTGKPMGVNLADKLTKVFKHALHINGHNNSDATGVSELTLDGREFMYKDAVPSPEYLVEKSGDASSKVATDTFVIAGHTRYGTVGGNDISSAHPFIRGDITLMQNGTSYSTDYLLNSPDDAIVDSDQVAYSINSIGAEKTFKAYEGAGVFMWIDNKDKTFNIIKNAERNLNITKVKGHEIYIIMTDPFSIEYVCNRANLAIEEVKCFQNNCLFKYYTNGNITLNSNVNVNEEVYPISAGSNKSSWYGSYGDNINYYTQPSNSCDNFIECCVCGNFFAPEEGYFKSGNEIVCTDCEDIAKSTFGLVLEKGECYE